MSPFAMLNTKRFLRLLQMLLLFVNFGIIPYYIILKTDTSFGINQTIDSLQMQNNKQKYINFSVIDTIANFTEQRLFRAFYSDKCNFVYFTVYKAASLTAREAIHRSECGLGANFYKVPCGNNPEACSCNYKKCNASDIIKLKNTNNRYFSFMFVRHPVIRFESAYNYIFQHRKQILFLQNHFYQWRMNNRNEYLHLQNITNGNSAEMKYLFWIKFWYNQLLKHNLKGFNGRSHLIKHIFRHFQPIYLCSCFDTNCFVPNFIGTVEHFMDNIHFINKEDKLNIKIKDNIFNMTHTTKHNLIQKGVTYKYLHALLLICQIYWNDFICTYYNIPSECKDLNEKYWHFPDFCSNVQHEQVEWPQPHI
eukprot:349726_1